MTRHAAACEAHWPSVLKLRSGQFIHPFDAKAAGATAPDHESARHLVIAEKLEPERPRLLQKIWSSERPAAEAVTVPIGLEREGNEVLETYRQGSPQWKRD